MKIHPSDLITMSHKKSFHLRWNNHLQNLQTLFENLYIEQSLIDVTISCSDGQLHAHKLLLSACSPYFEQIFKDNPCEHPVMILKGISRKEMSLLLDYMYKGAVNVAEEDLDIMLDTASELQIKGLIQGVGSGVNTPPPETLNNEEEEEDMKHFSYQQSTHSQEEDLRWQAQLLAKPSQSNLQIKSERNTYMENLLTNSTEPNVLHRRSPQPQQNGVQIKTEPQSFNMQNIINEQVEDSFENEEEPDVSHHMETVMEGSQQNISIENIFPANGLMSDAIEFNWVCHICQKKFQNKLSHQRHMLTHAGVKPNICEICGRSFLRLSHLQRHVRVHTGERPYPCTQCNKEFSRSDKLRQHYILQHNSPHGGRGRGRPRKNVDLYASARLPMLPTGNTAYPVSISPVSAPSITMTAN